MSTLLKGHIDFEWGIHYGKVLPSLLLIPLHKRKTKQNPLHNPDSLLLVCIIVSFGVHCLTWCKYQVHSPFFQFNTATIYYCAPINKMWEMMGKKKKECIWGGVAEISLKGWLPMLKCRYTMALYIRNNWSHNCRCLTRTNQDSI